MIPNRTAIRNKLKNKLTAGNSTIVDFFLPQISAKQKLSFVEFPTISLFIGLSLIAVRLEII